MIEALNGWKLMSTIVIYFHNINFRSTTDMQTKNTPPPELQKYIYMYIFFINRQSVQKISFSKNTIICVKYSKGNPEDHSRRCFVFNVLEPLFNEKGCINLILFISMNVIYMREKTVLPMAVYDIHYTYASRSNNL